MPDQPLSVVRVSSQSASAKLLNAVPDIVTLAIVLAVVAAGVVPVAAPVFAGAAGRVTAVLAEPAAPVFSVTARDESRTPSVRFARKVLSWSDQSTSEPVAASRDFLAVRTCWCAT